MHGLMVSIVCQCINHQDALKVAMDFHGGQVISIKTMRTEIIKTLVRHSSSVEFVTET